jgi:hypothetical protein
MCLYSTSYNLLRDFYQLRANSKWNRKFVGYIVIHLNLVCYTSILFLLIVVWLLFG